MCLNKNAILNYRYNFYFDETIQICNIVMILTTALTASSTVPPSFVSILMSSNAELYIFIFMKHALSIVFQNSFNVLNYPLLSSILKQTWTWTTASSAVNSLFIIVFLAVIAVACRTPLKYAKKQKYLMGETQKILKYIYTPSLLMNEFLPVQSYNFNIPSRS